MTSDRDDDVRPLHVFDQTNGVLKDEEPDADERRPRGTRRAGEANVALGAHQTITGAQGGF